MTITIELTFLKLTSHRIKQTTKQTWNLYLVHVLCSGDINLFFPVFFPNVTSNLCKCLFWSCYVHVFSVIFILRIFNDLTCSIRVKNIHFYVNVHFSTNVLCALFYMHPLTLNLILCSPFIKYICKQRVSFVMNSFIFLLIC